PGRLQTDRHLPTGARAVGAGGLRRDRVGPRKPAQRRARQRPRGGLLDPLAQAPPPRLGARGRVVPRAGPGGGRLLPRNVHRPVARGRPPPPRVDGQLSANRVGASSSSSTPVYV